MEIPFNKIKGSCGFSRGKNWKSKGKAIKGKAKLKIKFKIKSNNKTQEVQQV